MAATLPKFVFTAVPAFPRSPKPPPPPPLGGDICWRATVFVNEGEHRIASFMGYDTTITIADATHKACLVRHKDACSEAQLTLLPTTRAECSGHIFIYKNGSVNRLL